MQRGTLLKLAVMQEPVVHVYSSRIRVDNYPSEERDRVPNLDADLGFPKKNIP